MSDETLKADIFYQIRNGTRAAAAMLAGMQLDLFTPLNNRSLSPEQLAAELDLNAEKLAPLLYALVLAGLLVETSGTFANTPEVNEFLVRGKPRFMGNIHKLWYKNLMASLQTAETIRTGIPQSKYDWRAQPETDLMELYEGMAASDALFARMLSDKFDFSDCQKLLDAGGGSGTLAIAMTDIHPQMTATVVELPQVAPITEHFIKKFQASEKVRVVSADLTFDPIPDRYDVVFLSSVIQTLSAEEARQVIANIGEATNPGGRLYIFGSGMLEDSRLAPAAGVQFNLVFINVYDKGQSHTETEHRTWLDAAGFEEIDFRYDELIITAQKRKQ